MTAEFCWFILEAVYALVMSAYIVHVPLVPSWLGVFGLGTGDNVSQNILQESVFHLIKMFFINYSNIT